MHNTATVQDQNQLPRRKVGFISLACTSHVLQKTPCLNGVGFISPPSDYNMFLVEMKASKCCISCRTWKVCVYVLVPAWVYTCVSLLGLWNLPQYFLFSFFLLHMWCLFSLQHWLYMTQTIHIPPLTVRFLKAALCLF